MTSTSSTATPGKLGFDGRVIAAKPPKSDINALILDYLTMEGYPKAAAHFSKEANLKPQQQDSSIRTRQQIQNFIHMGKIEEAIVALNYLNPEILDQDPPLHFALLRLQLVELIRNCDTSDMQSVLAFATDQLGTRASTRPEFLRDLEETMSLLFFAPDKLPHELKKLLSPDLREEVADKVNKAILRHNSLPSEAAIRQLVKMRAWAEDVARVRKNDIPVHIDLGLQSTDNDNMPENGHEPMITT
ncbi:ctlh domain containing protein [Grosmannia clavigera kw1407]|uniref:Ctlh domain containing protein n=1 Tax=Grosmannia clavigera (strain kw1407 / UAMH 11150) TaxID=655863 RepID=F0XER8_GROCL|nr:ctlh domain containing protein [Grosmannia clavigera kw1407]EFX04468.1 ctlh domain containing protein [Grosmannia clavigera kw1407]